MQTARFGNAIGTILQGTLISNYRVETASVPIIDETKAVFGSSYNNRVRQHNRIYAPEIPATENSSWIKRDKVTIDTMKSLSTLSTLSGQNHSAFSPDFLRLIHFFCVERDPTRITHHRVRARIRAILYRYDTV